MCTKGDKCKYSHNLLLKGGEKPDIYIDQRNTKGGKLKSDVNFGSRKG
jgi:hypothetical protein